MKGLYHKLRIFLILIFALSTTSMTIAVVHSYIQNRYEIRGIDLNIVQQLASVFSAHSNKITDASATKNSVDDSVKILVLGDMMFDRGVRSQINSKGFEYVFGPATTTFAQYDVVIANLEGPITTNTSKTVITGNKAIPGFQFTFPVNTAKALKDAGIDMVSLANNHTENFGQDGLNQTRELLSEQGISYFGSPANINTNFQISTSTCIRGMCIGFIGWHEFGTKNYQNVIDEIVRMRPLVQYLVVFPHWGVEYEHSPSDQQQRLARTWLDAGADVVIGAHPHVVQRIEKYTTKDGRITPIFYSLGNFLFDQYFSFATTHGIGVEIKFENTNSTSTKRSVPSYKILPFSSVKSKISIPDATSSIKMFSILEKYSEKDVWKWLGGLR